ncbi:hypothetical protein CWS20_13940 [Cytobacillus horneckiae]|uniref:Uncharacterized protein n=1 Tax=Cytobacillus horneckiae TaxID=549687 RepID=A0A2N0ZFN2_9BACI|nr:hypothetical protein CWS20_13940 [Cytobacillus horneckiae]
MRGVCSKLEIEKMGGKSKEKPDSEVAPAIHKGIYFDSSRFWAFKRNFPREGILHSSLLMTCELRKFAFCRVLLL